MPMISCAELKQTHDPLTALSLYLDRPSIEAEKNKNLAEKEEKKIQDAKEQQKKIEKENQLRAEIEKDRPSWVSARQEAERLAGQGEVVIIKQLYLGMDIYEAVEILEKELGEKLEVEKKEDGTFEANVENRHPIWDTLKATQDKKVISMFFTVEVTRKLFNSNGVDAEHFLESFSTAYKIGPFEPYFETRETIFGQAEDHGWRYSSPKGFKVVLMAGTTSTSYGIRIEKITPQNQMKFN